MNNHECTCGHCGHEVCTHRVPIFSGLNQEEMKEVTNLILHKAFEKGEILLQEAEPVESMMIINKGQVKAFTYSLEGKEQILYIFATGDFIGEKNILKDAKATYYVEALEETMVCLIRKQDFRKLLMVHPEIALKVIEALSERMESLEDAISNMATKRTEVRVNIVLLEFAKRYGRPHTEGILVDLPLSREGIANYIGVTRETVSRKLSLLQEEGMIRLVGNKKLIILDRQALEASLEEA